MTTYVIDKDGKVIENRPSMTRAQADAGGKFVAAWDNPGKSSAETPRPWEEGEKIPPTSILTSQQLKEVALCNLSHIKNAALRT